MGLEIKIRSPIQYATAVSGIFANKKSPNGLTRKEIKVVALLMMNSKHGVITKEASRKTREMLNMESQPYYNMITVLRKKKVILGEELNKIFTTKSIVLKNES